MYKTQVYLFKDDPNRKGPEGCGQENEFLHIVQGETGSGRLEFHLMQDASQPIDLIGEIVTFYLTKPNGEKFSICRHFGGNGGRRDNSGHLDGTVHRRARNHQKRRAARTSADDSILKFPVPDLFISHTDTEAAVESTSESQALDLALSKIESALTNSESALASAQQVLDSDRAAVSTQSLTPMNGLQVTSNNVCKIVSTNLLHLVTAELKATAAIAAWQQILSLPAPSPPSFT